MKTHNHKWKAVGNPYPFFCICGAMKVPDMRVGRKSIIMGASSSDLFRWTATQAATAAGDIGMDTTTGRPSMHDGSQAQAITNAVSNGDSAPGIGIYGDGTDGSISTPLTANVQMGDTEKIVRFTNLDLAGFTLTGSAFSGSVDQTTSMIYVSGTLTMGSGTIRSKKRPAGSGGSGGTGGGGNGGVGGDGARGVRGIIVFAQNVSGTGTIEADGDGVTNTGGDGGTPDDNDDGIDGGAGSTAPLLHSVQATITFNAGGDDGNGNFNGTGGFARDGGITNTTFQSLAKDLLRYFWSTPFMHGQSPGMMGYTSANAAGGGGGGQRNTDPGAGGASGGGGAGYGGSGGTSGAGGDGSSGLTTGGCGGGGGSGGSAGCLCYVVTEAISGGTLTVRADGTDGGVGGNGSNSQSGRGGGGGGGGGGIVLYIGPAGGSVSTSVAGGSGGAGGSGTGNGGDTGSSGSTGLLMEMEEET